MIASRLGTGLALGSSDMGSHATNPPARGYHAYLVSEEGKPVEVKLKLIASASPETFERRLNDFLASLDRDDIVVDVKFSTTTASNGVEYSALVHYQATDAWDD